MKSGYKTTEFWIALIAQVVPVLTLLGFLTPDEATELAGSAGAVVEAIGGLVIAITAVLIPLGYIWSRTKVKLGDLPFELFEENEAQ